MFDVERFKVEIGGDNGGDVDNGVPGSNGEALLLLEIGELVDQYLEEFSPEQAGMIDVTFFRFLFLTLYLIFFLSVISFRPDGKPSEYLLNSHEHRV